MPLTFVWRRGGTTLTNLIISSNVCYFTLANVQPSALTNISVGITNLAGTSSVSGSAYLYILLDLDRDGMADVWEQSFGFSTNNPADATADADLDGVSNADEYVAGTNPTNAASRFVVDNVAALAGGASVITFLAVSNRTYELDFTPGLAPISWTPSGTLAPAATNRLIRWTNAPPSPGGFHRLRIPQFP
jgi:hypothetical protein